MWLLLAPLFKGSTLSITKILAVFFTVQAVSIIVKILLALGIGFATYSLGTYALDAIYDRASSALSGAPAEFLSLVKFTRIDEALSIVFGAMAARMAMVGYSNGTKISPTFR